MRPAARGGSSSGSGALRRLFPLLGLAIGLAIGLVASPAFHSPKGGSTKLSPGSVPGVGEHSGRRDPSQKAALADIDAAPEGEKSTETAPTGVGGKRKHDKWDGHTKHGAHDRWDGHAEHNAGGSASSSSLSSAKRPKWCAPADNYRDVVPSPLAMFSFTNQRLDKTAFGETRKPGPGPVQSCGGPEQGLPSCKAMDAAFTQYFDTKNLVGIAPGDFYRKMRSFEVQRDMWKREGYESSKGQRTQVSYLSERLLPHHPPSDSSPSPSPPGVGTYAPSVVVLSVRSLITFPRTTDLLSRA
jgi:hypothetical protein